VIVAAAISVVLWASAFVAIRYAGRELSPGPLALARLMTGSIVLGAAMLGRRERPPSGRALALAIVSGLLWFGIYNLALNAAERRIDAGTSALLVNTGPIFIALMAGWLLREGFPRMLIAGCTVAFGGVALIAVAVSRHGVHGTWGAALCIIAALAYAGGIIAQKPALRETSALALTWVACTVAALVCLPYAPELVRQLGHARASAVAWTVYLGVGPLAIGFGSWSYALARSSAGRLGATTYLVPPLVVLLSWAALGEVPPVLALPGGILCLAGVALTRRRGAAGEPTRPPAAGNGSAVVVTSASPR